MRYEIRALDIGGVLDQTLKLFRDHFLFLAVVAGCLLLLPQLVVSMVSATMMTALMAAVSSIASRAISRSAAPDRRAIGINSGSTAMLASVSRQSSGVFALRHFDHPSCCREQLGACLGFLYKIGKAFMRRL